MPKTPVLKSPLALRECPSCQVSFQPYRATQVACSRRCYYQQPSAKERKNQARRVGLNPERTEANRAALLRQKYGLDMPQYRRMLAEQNGQCAICGVGPADGEGFGPSTRLHVDHDHATGAVRALLCTSCNNGLGRFRDSVALLRQAVTYLELHAA